MQGTDLNWRVLATSVTPAENLIGVQLLDGAIGKAVGEKGTIFETADGGLSWRRLPGGLPRSDFSQVFFVNKSLGWAVVAKSRSSTSAVRKVYDAHLIRTENGGKSWSVQYTVKNGSLNQIRFVNDQEGWAVGSTRKLENDDETGQVLVLHTVDQGRHWNESLRNSWEADSNEADLNDLAEDIYVEAASKATLVTSDGAILATEDAGKNWHSIKMPESSYPQLANLHIWKDEAHQLWVLSAANSREVLATRLARMDQNSRWATIELPDWYISDVKSLPPTLMVACGFIGQKSSQRPIENSEGIVAFSSDNGQTWRIIYRTKAAPRINTLAVLGPDQLLALGDNGWVFKIYKASQIDKAAHENGK